MYHTVGLSWKHIKGLRAVNQKFGYCSWGLMVVVEWWDGVVGWWSVGVGLWGFGCRCATQLVCHEWVLWPLIKH